MKKLLILLILAIALLAIPVSAEMVVNQTTCNAFNNLGTAINTYGQSFFFNASAGNTIIENVEFRFINASSTILPAGTQFRLRLHYNESATNSTVLYTTDVNPWGTVGGDVAAVNCGSGQQRNMSPASGSGNLSWAVNLSGNYTVTLEIQNEGSGQLWEWADTGNPYLKGKQWDGLIFDAPNDINFRIWAASATSVSTFQITARDSITNVALTTFNATVTNNTGSYWFSTTNGTIVTNLSGTQTVNISVNSSNYFTNLTSLYSTATSPVQMNLTQWTALYVGQFFGGGAVNNFSASYQNNSGTFNLGGTTGGVFYFPLYNGNWNVSVINTGHNGRNFSNASALLNATTFLRNYTVLVYPPLNLTARDTVSNVALTTFNVTINGTTYTTTNGTVNSNFFIGSGNVTLSGIAPYYFQNYSSTYNLTNNVQLNLTQWTAIYVKYIVGSVSLSNFSVNYTNLTSSYGPVTTTTGVAYVPLYNGNWNFTVYDINNNGINFSMANATLNATTPAYLRNYTFYVFTTNSFNFTFRDEQNSTILYSENSSAENIIVELLGSLVSYNYSANGTLYVDLLTPQSYVIRYSKPGYGILRQYLITLTNQTSTNIDLYLIRDSVSSTLTITVYDQVTLNTVESAVVYLQRFNLTCNCYLTVAMYQTDVGGNAYFDVELQNELYKFVVEYPWQTVLFTSEPIYIQTVADPINLYITDQAAVGDIFFNASNMNANIYFTNSSGDLQLNLQYSDPAATGSQYCFAIKRWTRYTNLVVNQSCSTSPSGTITLGGLEEGQNYYGIFTAMISGVNTTIATGWKEVPTDNLDLGSYGVFLTLIIYITFLFIGYQYHIVAIILANLSLAFSKLMGIFPIDWGYIIIMILASLILALFIDKK